MSEYPLVERLMCLMWVAQIPVVEPWFIWHLAETFFRGETDD